MYFCPLCRSMLLPEQSRQVQLSCCACPYTYRLSTTFSHTKESRTKQIDEVMGGKDALQYASTCSAKCPKCAHEKALYFELQTRSADEPMTIFYKCTKCHFDWKE